MYIFAFFCQNKNSGYCQTLVSNPRYRGIIRDIATLYRQKIKSTSAKLLDFRFLDIVIEVQKAGIFCQYLDLAMHSAIFQVKTLL